MWKIIKYLILFSILGSMEARIQALEQRHETVGTTVASASTVSAGSPPDFIPPFIGWGRSGNYSGNGSVANWDQYGGHYSGNGSVANWDQYGGHYSGNGSVANWTW